MTSGKARWEKRENCSSVGCEPGEDIGAITMNAADNPYMFSSIREGDEVSVDINRRDNLGILHL